MTGVRPRFGSKPGREVYAPDVYEILAEHDQDIKDLKGYAEENKLDNAKILKEVRDLAATDRHATTKLIGAAIATVVTTIAGVVGTLAATRPSPQQAPVVEHRSALDRKMDECRAMAPGPSRSECFVRIASEPEQ